MAQRKDLIPGSPKYRERMAGYTELWITGSREILRLV
jgi:hypothetical protein